MGFTRLYSDPCAYIKRQNKDFQIITVWVDDLLIFAKTKVGMCLTKEKLVQRWQITNIGKPTKIIGIQIKRRPDSISISQQKYIEAIQQKENMEQANPVATPLDPNVPVEPNPEEAEGNCSNLFAQLLGELQYLANATRPDIAFAINRLASYTTNPSMKHYDMLKRILRYLAGTKEYAITYRKSYTKSTPVIGYADTAHANTDEQKSTSGIVFTSAGGAILWKSKKQTLSAQSSTKAEYITLAQAGCEAQWFRNLYTELGFTLEDPAPIHCDNWGTITMTGNPYSTQRLQHIDLKWHTIRQLTEKKLITIIACRDADQTANILTKHWQVPQPKHKKCAGKMGLVPA
jgi:hypothetical protein